MFLYPSEIARLLLGYLKVEGLSETHSTFLNECKYLYEYKEVLRKGHTPKTEVFGCDLVTALNDYFDMKSRAISLVDEYLRNVKPSPAPFADRPAMVDAAIQTELQQTTTKDTGTVTINPVKLKRNKEIQTQQLWTQIQSTQTDFPPQTLQTPTPPQVVLKDAAMMTTECLSETASGDLHLHSSRDDTTLNSHGVEELLLTTPPRSVPIPSTNLSELTTAIPGGRNVILNSTSPVKVSVDMFSVIESLLGKSDMAAKIAENINKSLISSGDDACHRNLMDVDDLLDMPLTEDDTRKIAEMTVNDPIFKSFIHALPIEISAAMDSMSPFSTESGQTDTNDEHSNHSTYSTHSNMSSISNVSSMSNISTYNNNNNNNNNNVTLQNENAEAKKEQQYTTIDLTSLRSLNACSSFIQLGNVHAHVRQLDFGQKSPSAKRRRLSKRDDNQQEQQQQQAPIAALPPAATITATTIACGTAAPATVVNQPQRISNLIDENSIAKISITEASQLVLDTAAKLVQNATVGSQQQQQKSVEVRGTRVNNRRGRRALPLNKKLSQKSIECKLQQLDVEKILSKFYK